jgi:hypothetical protein
VATLLLLIMNLAAGDLTGFLSLKFSIAEIVCFYSAAFVLGDFNITEMEFCLAFSYFTSLFARNFLLYD